MHRGLYGRHVGLVWLHLPHHWVRLLVCIRIHDHTFMGVNVRCDQPGVGVGVGAGGRGLAAGSGAAATSAAAAAVALKDVAETLSICLLKGA